MYKNKEKKLNLLLDKLLMYATQKDSLRGAAIDYEITHFLMANKELLPVNIQKKIIQILPVSHSYTLLRALQSKDYQHLSCEIVKLLDLSDPFFSCDVIETLYKMGTWQFVDEIRPFATLNIDDKMPFTQVSYRIGYKFFSKYPPNANSSFKVINNEANKYIKRANKLKNKHIPL